jgi:FixJ family two-component response regulator
MNFLKGMLFLEAFQSKAAGGLMGQASLVYVVDDDARSLDGLDALLTSQGFSVRTFAFVDDFLSLEKPSVPACLILDLKPGDCGRLAVPRRLSGNGAMPVIFVSEAVDVRTTVEAMRAGASEFLLKPFDEEYLLSAVRAALKQADAQWADGQLVWRIRKCYLSLTPREREVLPYIVRGFLNKQTAYELGTSEITIRIHRGQIMRKMKAASLAELVWFAERLGIPDRASMVQAFIGA